MKKSLALLNCLLIAALICSAAIPPTRKTVGSEKAVTTSGRPDMPRASSVTGSRAQEPPLVSGEVVQSRPQDRQLSRQLSDYDLIKLDPRAAVAQIRNTGRLLLNTSKRKFDLQLTLNDLRASDYVGQVIGSDGVPHQLPKLPVNTYKGSVPGMEGAQARVAVVENSIEGAIITDSERYFIQPARSLSKSAKDDEFVFYSGSAVAKEAGTCGVTLAQEVAAEQARAGADAIANEVAKMASPVTGLSPMKIVRLATEADAEYVNALGGASQANNQISNIMNLVDGIYQVEIGLTFQIAFQDAWSDPATDPYSSSDANALLDQFKNYWNTNFTTIQRSVAHLWTGKTLNASVIGISYVATACRTQFAYSLSRLLDTSNPVGTVVVTAHEIGHNFSALHTNETNVEVPPDIEQACANTIMQASLGDGSNFCPFSRSQILGYTIGSGSCLLDSSSGPTPFANCVETPINTTGVNTSGSLSSSDCRAPSRGVRFFADRYSFIAPAGQQVTITMTKTSGNLDPYIYLVGPDGLVVVQDDNSNGSNNARIPNPSLAPAFTLPLTGKYIVEATSFGEQQTGDYNVSVTFASCALSTNPASQSFSASGGNGTINVTPVGNCNSYRFSVYPATVSSWLSTQVSGGSGQPESLGFNVQPNSNAAGRRGFLLIAPSGNFGGLRIPIYQAGSGPDCSVTPIASSQTVSGNLASANCQSPVRGNGFYAARYFFTASPGQQVAITLSSTNVPRTAMFLTLIGPNGTVILTADSTDSTNARIPGGTAMLNLGLPGAYVIEATTFDSGGTSPYTLTLNSSGANPIDQADFFVRQHYLDFLNRAPDPTGFTFWTSQITSCGADAQCIELRRINASAAFYLSIEFQQTGYLVYRIYKAAYGNPAGMPVPVRFNELLPETQLIGQGVEVGIGDWQTQLENNKVAFTQAFVQRPNFLSAFPLSMTAVDFVNKLDTNAGGVLSAAEKSQLVGVLGSTPGNTAKRASVLRSVTENQSLSNAEFNKAFVLMQYFGYLRRNPNDAPDTDYSGYNFWLAKLNQFNGNFVSAEMVKAFVESAEYTQRFAP